MKTTLGQYCINVSNMEKSVKFYQDVLGLTIKTTIKLDFADEVLLSGDEGTVIQLAHQHDHTGPIDHGNAFWKLYVNTDDCQGLYDRAMEAGCESITAPARLDRWPVTAAFIRDPDGYQVEILEHHDE